MKSLELVREYAVWKALRTAVRSFASDRSGSVAVMAALAMPVLIGVTGLGVEVSYWYLTQRSMQNAADSAAIAAATNGTANYSAEAQSSSSKIWLCAWGKQYLGHSVEHGTMPFGRRKLLQRDHHGLRPFVSVSGCRLPRHRDGGRIATNNAEREGCCAA